MLDGLSMQISSFNINTNTGAKGEPSVLPKKYTTVSATKAHEVSTASKSAKLNIP